MTVGRYYIWQLLARGETLKVSSKHCRPRRPVVLSITNFNKSTNFAGVNNLKVQRAFLLFTVIHNQLILLKFGQ